MNRAFISAVIVLIAVQVNRTFAEDPPTPQVLIETKIVETSNDFQKEIGIDFGVGPTISHLTNGAGDPKNVVGITALFGMDAFLNRILGVYSHAFFTQFGEKYEYPGGSTKFKVHSVGVEAGVKLHIVPEQKIDGFVKVGIKTMINVRGTQTVEVGGLVDKSSFEIGENDSRVTAGITAGGGVTIRNDIMDLTLQGQVTVGLNDFQKNLDDKRVPVLAEIPLIFRFFKNREKQQERKNLIIFITPKVLDGAETE